MLAARRPSWAMGDGPMPSDRNPVVDTLQARELELDADKARFLFDDPMLDRIIDAGCVVGRDRPPGLDRDRLRRELIICYGRYCLAAGPGQSGSVKRQGDRLNSIRKHASKLAELLKAEEADLGLIRAIWPIDTEHPAQLFTQMVFLVELIDAMEGLRGRPGDIAERNRARLGVSGSALQWMVGTLLPAVYVNHFGKKAGRSHLADGGIGGPYVRFARQVLAETRIKCSDETIATYVGFS
jgi:hypothetical protein